MNRDRYDLPLTTSSDRAAAHYRDGVDCMLSAWHGAEDAFDKAIAQDPGFALAHIGRARLHQLNMEGSQARAMAAQARELVAGATPREKSHVEIIAAVIESKPRLAVSGAEAHLEEYPRDAQVLSMLLGAFGLYAFSGRSDHDAAKLAICERHARHYGEDWWFLSYLGWSHTEAGNLTTGRKLSERAMSQRAANANAAHGLSHAMFEQGDMETGRSFLSQWMPAHDRQSFLHGHLAWHVALTALDTGDLDGALATYEQHIKPAGRPYPPLNIFTDGTSLLWRLSLAGKTGLDEHWRDITAYGEKYFPQAGAHFADVHFALARGGRRRCAGHATGPTGGARHRRQAGAGPRRDRAVSRYPIVRRRRQCGRDPLSGTGDFRTGADRWQPRAARIVGRHADRGVPTRRPRRQGCRTHLDPARPQALGA